MTEAGGNALGLIPLDERLDRRPRKTRGAHMNEGSRSGNGAVSRPPGIGLTCEMMGTRGNEGMTLAGARGRSPELQNRPSGIVPSELSD
jgi:hypothetical protein